VDSPRLLAAAAAALARGPAVAEGHVLHRCKALLRRADRVVVLDVPADVCRERRLARQPRTEAERGELGGYIDRVVTPHYEGERAFLSCFRGDPRFVFAENGEIEAGRVMEGLEARAAPARAEEIDGFAAFAASLKLRGCEVRPFSHPPPPSAGRCVYLSVSPERVVGVAAEPAPPRSLDPPPPALHAADFHELARMYNELVPTCTHMGVTVLADSALVDGLGGVVWDGAYVRDKGGGARAERARRRRLLLLLLFCGRSGQNRGRERSERGGEGAAALLRQKREESRDVGGRTPLTPPTAGRTCAPSPPLLPAMLHMLNYQTAKLPNC
jgi:hypothetical protein